MAQSNEGAALNASLFELTPIEKTLRQFLLDVADHIFNGQDAHYTPGASDKSKLVLRFTGGWVRDKLLGVDSHDIDVAISTMTGYQFGLALKDYLDLPSSLEKYRKLHPDGELHEAIVNLHKIEANPERSKHLETVTTRIFGLDIDLVNLRKETYSEESRNPQMEFGTPKEDALRRDATVNALFYNLHTAEIEDFTAQGLRDMELKIIRTPLPPYQTFKDDPLRVLRLIRFASRLNYQIDPDAQEAMKEEGIKAALKIKISRERVGIEIEKMLRGPDPQRALQYIDNLGLYDTIFVDTAATHYPGVDTSSWHKAYNGLKVLIAGSQNKSNQENQQVRRLMSLLVRNADEAYYSWLLAAFVPWSTIPPPVTKSGKDLLPVAVVVAKHAIKADNKISKILSGSVRNREDIVRTKDELLGGKAVSPGVETSGRNNSLRRDLGLALRRWGPQWRLQVVFAMLWETVYNADDQAQDVSKAVSSYDQFLNHLCKLDLLEACELQPLVDGNEIRKVLGVKPGPWLKAATEMVIAWQLENPDRTDPEGALEEVKQRKSELGL